LWAESSDEAFGHAADAYAQKNWQIAEERLAKFVQEHPEHTQAAAATFLLAETRVQLGRYPEARAGFLAFLERHPQHRLAPSAEFRAAEAAYQAGQRADAQRELQRFRQRHPDDHRIAYVLTYLADLALAASQGPQAQQLYAETLQRFPQGPTREECRFGLGRAAELQGRFDDALRAYKSLVQGGRLADDAQVQIGIAHYNRGQYGPAEQSLRAAVTDFPRSELQPMAKYWLGMAQMAQGRCQQAAQTLQDAARSHPADPLAAAMTFSAGEALRLSGDKASAQALYEQVVAKWSQGEWLERSLQLLVQLAFEAADYERVDAWAHQFDVRCAGSPLRSAVWEIAGRSLLQRQQYAQALPLFERLVRDASQKQPSPAVPDANHGTPASPNLNDTNCYYLAMACLGIGKHREALAALARVCPGPERPQLADGVRVAEALAYLGLEQYAEAIPRLRAYLASQPNGLEASRCRLELAAALGRTGVWEEALRLHSETSASDAREPYYPAATHALAEAAYAARRLDDAGRLYRVLADGQFGDRYEQLGLSGLGWTQFESGAAPAAAETFGRLVARHPRCQQAADAAWMRAQALEKSGQAVQALEAYVLVTTSFAASEHGGPAMLEAARLQEAQGQRQAAADLLQRFLQERPQDKRMADALYQRAWLLVDLQRPSEAEPLFAELADKHRHTRYWADATYRLAELAARGGQHGRARQLAQTLIDAECDSLIQSHALYLQGRLAATAGHWRDATPPLQTLLDKFSDTALRLPAEYWIAESCYRTGQFDEAAARFTRLDRDRTDRREPWMALIPLRRAQLLARQEKWDEAQPIAAGIAAAFPGFRQVYEADYVVGICLAGQRKFPAAREMLERVIRSPNGGRSETAAMAQYQIGETYFQEQQYAEALQAYQRTASLYSYPQWQAAALAQAGKCHELCGQPQEAVKSLRQLVQDHPHTAYAEEASRKLHTLGQEIANMEY
jgi:TolA-binding protein